MTPAVLRILPYISVFGPGCSPTKCIWQNLSDVFIWFIWTHLSLTLVIRATIVSHQPLEIQHSPGKVWQNLVTLVFLNQQLLEQSTNTSIMEQQLEVLSLDSTCWRLRGFHGPWPEPKALSAVLSHRTNVTRSSASASHVTVLVPGRIAYQLLRSLLKTGERRRLLICTWWFQDVT